MLRNALALEIGDGRARFSARNRGTKVSPSAAPPQPKRLIHRFSQIFTDFCQLSTGKCLPQQHGFLEDRAEKGS